VSLFRQIADACEAAGVRTILAGGHAVNHYGHSRLTMDIDLIIPADKEEEAARALSGMGFEETQRSGLFLRFQHGDPDMPDVDLLLVDEATFRRIEADAVRVRIDGRDFLIPSVDVLISMKLHALRYGRHRLLKDGGDIVALLIHTGRTPDDIADLGERYGSPEVMKEIRFLYECENRSGPPSAGSS
jgi:hypothetical protein